MKNTATALQWIVTILEKHQYPYQITGGLAAQIYGATREIADIDIDIPEAAITQLQQEVAPYIIAGPERFQGELWDLYLMTLNYQGQEIDLSGAYETKIFNVQSGFWQPLLANFSTAKLCEVHGLLVPVIEQEDLIRYKTVLNRDVDQIDIQQMCSKPK
ncbi:hypothetical protein BH10PSE19_BH10PSE19_09200 [soil metagenome]